MECGLPMIYQPNSNSRGRHSDSHTSRPESRQYESEVLRVFRDLLGWDNPDTTQLPLTDKQCYRGAWISSGSGHRGDLASSVVVVYDSITEHGSLSRLSFNLDPQR